MPSSSRDAMAAWQVRPPRLVTIAARVSHDHRFPVEVGSCRWPGCRWLHPLHLRRAWTITRTARRRLLPDGTAADAHFAMGTFQHVAFAPAIARAFTVSRPRPGTMNSSRVFAIFRPTRLSIRAAVVLLDGPPPCAASQHLRHRFRESAGAQYPPACSSDHGGARVGTPCAPPWFQVSRRTTAEVDSAQHSGLVAHETRSG